ncbi:histidine phosphatase family protein [Butyrivibrio sp. YAB3001]|uniref:histidine phosphatase family protein n=1 Tax=Butyrivibrio sp. YAB3001 TaxID=1520812 RepID=UPI0008F648E9|nr:histidine phosphatase family protein [Butyrivibrio sp. YAB3001]SFB74464.1 alpha-ribazole phosphatase [Butyrivibrio sp. YAB3001]
MKIWVTRHGQTELNARKLMQGRIDIPLNETGKKQALSVRDKIGAVKFDAVYSSPLCRAVETASVISGFDASKIIIDERIIEADFGIYDNKPYAAVGLPMTLYWTVPELFPAPETAETIDSMKIRVNSFFADLEQKDYQNVLIACHGGIIRVIRGYLENAKRGYIWRPRPKNCEVRVYQSVDGGYELIEDIL